METIKYIYINNFKNVNITNSSLRTTDFSTTYRSSALIITNYNQDCEVSIKNCMIDVGNILTTNEASNKSINLTLDNNIFTYDYNKIIDTNWTYNSDVYPESFLPINTYVHTNIVNNTNVSTLDTSATDDNVDRNIYNILAIRLLFTSATDEFKTNLYYLHNSDTNYLKYGSYKNFTDTNIIGSELIPTNANDLFDGSRDGVGAYYFPTPRFNLTQSSTSGTTPYDVTISTSANTANIYSVEFESYSETTSADAIGYKKYNFNFGDDTKEILYPLSAMDFYGINVESVTPPASAIDDTLVSTTPISADYTFTNPGVYDITVSANSLNGWNEYISDTYQVSAFASSVSADIEVYDVKTDTVITSATAYQDIQVKIFNYVGGVTSFDIDFNDTSTSGIEVNTTENYVDYFYTTSSDGPISITLYNNMNQTSAISATFTVGEATSTEYYVDIDATYISTNNEGTQGNPFSYDELVTRLSTSGDFNDVYYLKGLRKVESDTRIIIESNSNKSFTLDVWDAKLYGPWVMIFNDYEVSQASNSNISFKGCSLRNGIIYNKPNNVGGGILEITEITDMYIVWQGLTSIIKVTEDASNKLFDIPRIKACTIYSENGMLFN